MHGREEVLNKDEGWMRKNVAGEGFHHHGDEKRLGGRGSDEPLKGQRLRCSKDKN